MKEDRYEKDGFVFNSKVEYLKWCLVSILLVVAWFSTLIIISVYGEHQVRQNCERLCEKNNPSQCLQEERRGEKRMQKISPITSMILKTKTTRWFRSNMSQSNFATVGEYLSALKNIARLSGHEWLIDRCCKEVGAVSEEDYEIVVDTLIELARQELTWTR